MLRHIVERFEREASAYCKKNVTLSENSFYSGEQRSYYKKLVVDGKETRHHIDIMELQDSVSRDRMTDKVRVVAALILLG